MIYGYDGTIHNTGHLDVEVDSRGRVVAVWFRCMPLPFKQAEARAPRAQEMRDLYGEGEMPRIQAIVIDSGEPSGT